MRPRCLPFALLLLAACAEGDSKVEGTTRGRPAPAAAVGWAEIDALRLGLPGRADAIVFASDPDLCARATRGEVLADTELLVLVLAAATPPPARPPDTAGVYRIAETTAPNPPLALAAAYLPLDARCAYDPVRASVGLRGEVLLLTPAPDRLRGSFDLLLESRDELAGSFDVAPCPALAPLLSGATRLACR